MIVTDFVADETLFLRLAREIAMDIQDHGAVLKTLNVTDEQWENIKANPTFQRYLQSEVQSWETATNTHERVKLKAAALFEEWMPELYRRLNDRSESLAAKIEGGKLITKIAGMGLDRASIEGGGERFTISINLGADAKLTFEKTITPKVIDHSEDDYTALPTEADLV